jgi:hypothetical protein
MIWDAPGIWLDVSKSWFSFSDYCKLYG